MRSRVLAVGGLHSKRCLATPEAMRSVGSWAKLRSSAGARVRAPRSRRWGMSCSSLLGGHYVAAGRASARLDDRRVVEMRVLVHEVCAVEVGVRLWLEGILLLARRSIRRLDRLVRSLVGFAVTRPTVARGFRVVFCLGFSQRKLGGRMDVGRPGGFYDDGGAGVLDARAGAAGRSGSIRRVRSRPSRGKRGSPRSPYCRGGCRRRWRRRRSGPASRYRHDPASRRGHWRPSGARRCAGVRTSWLRRPPSVID